MQIHFVSQGAERPKTAVLGPGSLRATAVRAIKAFSARCEHVGMLLRGEVAEFAELALDDLTRVRSGWPRTHWTT